MTRVTGLQGYRAAGLLDRVTGLLAVVTGLQGYRVTGLQGYRVTGLQGAE